MQVMWPLEENDFCLADDESFQLLTRSGPEWEKKCARQRYRGGRASSRSHSIGSDGNNEDSLLLVDAMKRKDKELMDLMNAQNEAYMQRQMQCADKQFMQRQMNVDIFIRTWIKKLCYFFMSSH